MYKYLAPSSPNPFSPWRRGTKSLAPFSLWERAKPYNQEGFTLS
ncbi:hypothetical protein FDUTEX481_02566 [Tolypothrix sp. PCC 7601]|nr:hypothetical protein FDUTEX481_02566 [Tolypothrix sp. PCC 7601]